MYTWLFVLSLSPTNHQLHFNKHLLKTHCVSGSLLGVGFSESPSLLSRSSQLDKDKQGGHGQEVLSKEAVRFLRSPALLPWCLHCSHHVTGGLRKRRARLGSPWAGFVCGLKLKMVYFCTEDTLRVPPGNTGELKVLCEQNFSTCT